MLKMLKESQENDVRVKQKYQKINSKPEKKPKRNPKAE